MNMIIYMILLYDLYLDAMIYGYVVYLYLYICSILINLVIYKCLPFPVATTAWSKQLTTAAAHLFMD